ncbi:hypothetical protein Tco_0286771 [Tanacetum coccineum]
MVEHAEFDESNAYVLERLYTSAGSHVKEILLKLNLPDHRILKDGGEGPKGPWKAHKALPWLAIVKRLLSYYTDLDDNQVQIIEPLSKMTKSNKNQYIADVKVMNYLLQAIPNDIYNSVDACKNAKEM